MGILAKILMQAAKSIAIRKATQKDENGTNAIIIALGVVLGIMFLVAAFLQYILNNPIEALKTYFSESEIAVVEELKNEESKKNAKKYAYPDMLLDGRFAIGTDNEMAERLIKESFSHLGKPYVWSMCGPDSFDCSGLVAYCLRNSGVQQVPARPTCRTLWANDIVRVKHGEEKAGDLIFFSGTQPMEGATHIGIYLGTNRFIEANSSRGVVISATDSNWARNHFYGYGRPKALVREERTETLQRGKEEGKKADVKDKVKDIKKKDRKDKKQDKGGKKDKDSKKEKKKSGNKK